MVLVFRAAVPLRGICATKCANRRRAVAMGYERPSAHPAGRARRPYIRSRLRNRGSPNQWSLSSSQALSTSAWEELSHFAISHRP